MSTDPTVLTAALADLASAQTHDQALVELEIAADATGEALPDRATATFVAWVVRAIGAQRVIEVGAGRGALTWWLAGAIGHDGDLHVVTDAAAAPVVEDRLRRAGRAGAATVHAGDADGGGPDHLDAVDGEVDAIVVGELTDAVVARWAELVAKVRAGGVVVVGGVLALGPPTGGAATVVRDALEDPELWTTVVPLGSGWLVALKARSDLAGAASDRLL